MFSKVTDFCIVPQTVVLFRLPLIMRKVTSVQDRTFGELRIMRLPFVAGRREGELSRPQKVS